MSRPARRAGTAPAETATTGTADGDVTDATVTETGPTPASVEATEVASGDAAPTQGSPDSGPTEAPTPAPESAPTNEPAGTSPRRSDVPLVVTGAAVVLRTVDGGERYLYRGAPVPAGEYDKDSVKHARSIGLVGKK